MATLSVRNIPDEVHAALRVRAAQAGRSMEAEVRQILIDAVHSAPPGDVASVQAFVEGLYGGARPQGVVDELIEERRQAAAREP